MIIYMAGGISGNLNPCFRNMARKNDITVDGFIRSLVDENFLAGGESRHWLHDTSPIKENDMKLYLADSGKLREAYREEPTLKHHPFILESFYYADKETERLIPYFGDFMLDSGAFTFIQNSKYEIDWYDYIHRYAEFVNRNKIDKFFELDIDSIIGYDKVKEYRKLLERLTDRQCIPVWHRNRGYKEYIKLCEEYSYIAIGGIAIKEIKKEEYPIFTPMLKDAHERDCKVHGLGFTQLQGLTKYKFDSVDSTAWTTGNRFGFLYYFDGKTMKKIKRPNNHKIINSRQVALINYTEWIKFQKYAEENL